MFVYILESERCPDEFYVGITADVERRLSEHNAGKSLHTSKFIPWRIIGFTWFSDRSKAYAFERWLKSGSGRAFRKRHF